MLELETEQLLMRKLTLDDAEAMVPIYADTEIRRWMHIEAAVTLETEQDRITQHLEKYPLDGPYGFCASILKESGEIVGRCGLLRQTVDGETSTEVAYLIARSHWGRGLATEAATALRDYALETLGERRLISMILPDNIASQRVALKIGMSHERDTTWRSLQIGIYSLSRDRPSPFFHGADHGHGSAGSGANG